MLRKIQPGKRAFYVLTDSASDAFDWFTPNLAIEPTNQPGYVRLYWRDAPTDPLWRIGGTITADDARTLYSFPAKHDSSD